MAAIPSRNEYHRSKRALSVDRSDCDQPSASSSYPSVVVGFHARSTSGSHRPSPPGRNAHSLPRSLLSEGLRSYSGILPSAVCEEASPRPWDGEVPKDCDEASEECDQQPSSSYEEENCYSDGEESLSHSYSSTSSSWDDGDYYSRPIDIRPGKSDTRGNVADMLRVVNQRIQEDIERRQMAYLYAQKQCISKQRAQTASRA